MVRFAVFVYGVLSYLLFLATFCYAFGFVTGLWVPTTLDGAARIPWHQALLIDLGLLTMFALQHSVMARRWFKDRITLFIPHLAERPTYVLLSSFALISLFIWWQPIGGTVWQITDPLWAGVVFAVGVTGWAVVLGSTWLINHFDLFGLRHAWLALKGLPYTPIRFRTPGPYRLVRHPLYVGWLLAFWGTPNMTVAHLVFAAVVTAYILVAIQFEERDLIREHGADYQQYRQRVGMLVPRFAGGSSARQERSVAQGPVQ
ncbi:membrane protein [Planctomycetota bacterium]|nr:membrane protein [Planctomycetota bacterium]